MQADVTDEEQFYGCNCYYTKNYYLGQYGIHVEYSDDEKFLKTYAELLRSKGCRNKADINEVIEQLQAEFKRRKSLHSDASRRIEQIRASYVPLHSQLCVFEEEYLDKKFIDIVKSARRADGDAVRRLVEKESADLVYRMPVFTPKFCKMLIEQLNHIENSDHPKGRPNTMNNSGILLEEFGFNKFITILRMEYLNPLSQILFSDWGGGKLDSHKAFTVMYSEDQDLDLGFHYDNAEVTLNVSLGEVFDDGSLYFGSMRQDSKGCDKTTEVKHRICDGILHRGQHMHGALPISYGVRHNLIIWMRSSELRNQLCPMCDRKPELVPLPRYGEGFTVGKINDSIEVCQLV